MQILSFGRGLQAGLYHDFARDIFEIYLKEFTDDAKYGFRVRIPSEHLAQQEPVPVLPAPLVTSHDNPYMAHLALWEIPFKNNIPQEVASGEEAYIQELRANSKVVIVQLRHAVDWDHRFVKGIEFKIVAGPVDERVNADIRAQLVDNRLPYWQKVPPGGEYPEVHLEVFAEVWQALEEIGAVPKEE